MNALPTRPKRNYLPQDLAISQWGDVESFFQELEKREITSTTDFNRWLKDSSELDAVLEEDAAWRYIHMTIDTADEEKAESYRVFTQEIQPKIAPWSDRLNKKLANSSFASEKTDSAFSIYLRGVQSAIEIFREENVALQAELQELAQEYSSKTGGLTIDLDGNTLTMPQAGKELQSQDRAHRAAVYQKVCDARAGLNEDIDTLFNKLVSKRTTVAKNAGFDNYRDYKFVAMGRFDYGPEDCYAFHNSIEKAVLPLVEKLHNERKEKLGVDALKPYDLSIDPDGHAALQPFEKVAGLTEKSIASFANIDPYFGDCLRTMNEMGYLDLASKKGKAPGGYNYPLYEIGVPFIFMNAVGTQRDMVTMMHEGGHAVHSFLTRDLELTAYKGCPSEVAELASMAMELISMDQWHLFYENEAELKRAKKEQLKDVIAGLPWIALVDQFQHEVYTQPALSAEERVALWSRLEDKLSTSVVDWEGFENARERAWHKQLHLFEVPFYYIEYGMAQLGAIAVWRNYKQNPQKALQQYKEALALGYTKTIPEVYAAAGIRFDFSEAYVRELMEFVWGEMEAV